MDHRLRRNIGLSAAYFARCFPAARILGIEPEAGNVALARRNCAANGFSQVSFLQAAIASAPHKGGAVVDPGLGAWGFRVDPAAPGDLEFVSVDGLIEAPANAGLVPFIIKIDIEGFERDLFAANTGWIDRFHLLVVELHDWMLPSQASSRAFLRGRLPVRSGLPVPRRERLQHRQSLPRLSTPWISKLW